MRKAKRAPAWKDHPRLCGEKNDVLGDVREVSGSPPPMRGKVTVSDRKDRAFRITPAYAGKRNALCEALPQLEDHPRLCGEKQRGDITGMSFMGSPPPMRGKVRIS